MPRPNYFRDRAGEEVFLLTSPFIGLGRWSRGMRARVPLDVLKKPFTRHNRETRSVPSPLRLPIVQHILTDFPLLYF